MKHKYNLSSFTNKHILTTTVSKFVRNLVMIGFWALVLIPQALRAQASFTIDSIVVDAPVTFCVGNDGSIFPYVSGTGPFDYKVDGKPWCSCTTNFGGLTPGTHTVYVTDGSADTLSGTVVLATPDPIHVTFDVTQLSGCSNLSGQLTAHFTGGNNTPLLAYATVWSDSLGNVLNPYPAFSGYDSVISNLSAGIYSVTVTDNGGCSSSFSYNLPNLCLTLEQEISCNGANDGFVSAATAASGSWRYNIDGGPFTNEIGEFHDLTPGLHIIGIKNYISGVIVGYQSITLSEPSPLAIHFTWDAIPDCNVNVNKLRICHENQ